MNIKPKTFRATVDFIIGTESYATGDVVPAGPNLARLIDYGYVAADESKTPNDTKKEGSDNGAG